MTGMCRKVRLIGSGLVYTCHLTANHSPHRCDFREAGDFSEPGSILRLPHPGDIDHITGQPLQIGQGE